MQDDSKLTKNLMQALKEQESEFKDLKDFLEPIKMTKYKDTFIDQGITSNYHLQGLDEVTLENMKIPLGHKLKIMKKVKSMQPPAPKEVPVKASAGMGTEFGGGSLLDGTYDEAANAKEFQEALNAWRGKDPDKEKKQV